MCGVIVVALLLHQQAGTLQQRVRIRIAAHEAAIQLGGIFAVAARKDSIAETPAHFAAEDAALWNRVKASASSTSAHLYE